MCRNIKPLFNFDPPATEEEVYDAALQFVRKVSGFRQPSQANEEVFTQAVQDIAQATQELLGALVTHAPTRNREEEAVKTRERSAKRFG